MIKRIKVIADINSRLIIFRILITFIRLIITFFHKLWIRFNVSQI